MEDKFCYPNEQVWRSRRAWLDERIDEANSAFSYQVSDHSIALFMDMQVAFCSGAWLSVVIMSISVMDSHLRETEATDSRMGTALLLREYFIGDDIDRLRRLRNKYVHHNLDNPVFDTNQWFNNQEQFEKDARKATEMTIKVLFQSPGT